MAEAIDALFANSPSETKTADREGAGPGVRQPGGQHRRDHRGIVLAAVFFTILLVAGNTMAQSVRERTSELAVLKTLGFTNGQVLALVLGGVAACSPCSAAALGLALGWTLITLRGDPTHGSPPGLLLPAAGHRPGRGPDACCSAW